MLVVEHALLVIVVKVVFVIIVIVLVVEHVSVAIVSK